MGNKVVELAAFLEPPRDCSGHPVMLTDRTVHERLQKVMNCMHERSLDQLVVYGDVEHAGNFEYLVGFCTRFEESLLVIHADGSMSLVLGNENLDKACHARVTVQAIHAPQFSLPNQLDVVDKTMEELLVDAGIQKGSRIGMVGWKILASSNELAEAMFDIPSFIVDAVREIAGKEAIISNETDLFIGEGGVRTVNNANEIAHYEFAAALASDCVLDAMDALTPGITEMELGDKLARFGQRTSTVIIAATGPRFTQGNLYPTDNRVRVGDTVSLTVGYRGGLSSRTGYAASGVEDMPENVKDYVSAIAVPYYRAYVHWLESIHVGMTGGELFDTIDSVLPRERYGWSLCPGHLVAEEEWLASPVYEGSREVLMSGMMFQIDIIPTKTGYGGISAESTVVLADDVLRVEIRTRYPDLWERMVRRRAYLSEMLRVKLSDSVLPMCSAVAYLRPYLLDKHRAFRIAP